MEKVKTDTIARTLALAIALLNQVLAVAGKETLPFGEEPVYQFVSLALTLATSLVAWWKNNSFTAAAIIGDRYVAIFRNLDKKVKEVKS